MKQVLRYAGYIALIALAVFLFYRFYFIGVWILVAAVVSFIGQPIALFFERIHFRGIKIPRFVAALLALLVIILIFFGFLGIFVPLIVNQASTIADIDMDKLTESIEGPLHWIDQKLRAFGIIPDGVPLQKYIISQAKSLVGLGSVGSVVANILSVAGNIFIGVFSIFFISFFFIKDENMFEDDLLLVVPKKHHKATHVVIEDSKSLLKRYFIGVITEVFSVMLLISLGLWIFGVKNALLIGFFGGIMNIIPYLGPVIGSAIGILLGITSAMANGGYNDLMPVFFKLLGVFVAVQIIDNNVLVPIIYAKSVKSHPLEIFLVIVMGGSLAGFVGMLMAVPVYTILRVIAREFFQQFRVVQKLTETMD
ncbi:MAG TPA: AI-2E family transporter [Bacteroidales bacterium]|jgi:predicted PurR-regulated permease PerM|nr:AI-2E family transporter [Bacteroidales bacterium]